MVREWSHVRRILSAWEKSPRKQHESSHLSFYINIHFLEGVFAFLAGVVDRREFTSDYSLQLAIVICLYSSM